jgi:hypothetical protein
LEVFRVLHTLTTPPEVVSNLAQVLLLPQQVTIPTDQFTPFPSWVIVFIASLLLARIFNKWGRKVTPEGSQWGDLIIDVLVLLFVASAVAAASTTNLVGSLGVIVRKQENSVNNTLAAHSISIGAAALSVIILLIFGWLYASVENGITMFLFALAVLAAMALSGTVEELITWWMFHTVAWLWNAIMYLFIQFFNLGVTSG